MVREGCLNLTANTLNAAQAYAVIKFRRAIGRAYHDLTEAEGALISDCGLSIGEKGVLNGAPEKLDKFRELRDQLAEDLVDIGDMKALPYEAWHALKQENKGLADAYIEESLAGTFWLEPDDE